MKIVKNEKKYTSRCLALAHDLTEHFTPDTMEALARDLKTDLLYAAVDDAERVSGFLCLRRTSAQAAAITWLTVARNKWDRGPAAALLDRAAADARAKGARILCLKTLSPDTGYEPLAPAWRFYEKHGFLIVDTIEPYPGWEPGHPCAVMVKIL